MKAFVVFSALLVACTANPILLRDNRFIAIKSLQHDIQGSGLYNLRHESMDGTTVVESGSLILPAGAKEHGAAKQGEYSYTSPEGKVITTSYIADENGFRATGSHLPVGPPMPEEIRAMLPTLPKLVEVEDRPVFFRHHHSAPVVVREEHFAPLTFAPVIAPARVLLQEAAPEKTFVQTSDFLIDSSPSKTIVKIGN